MCVTTPSGFWFEYLTSFYTFLQKLKQHLQRTKQGSKSSQTYGRQSPLHGDHTAIPASRLPQSIPISIPLTPRPSEGPQKRSLEGLNTEIQKLVLTDVQTDRVSYFVFCLSVVLVIYSNLNWKMFNVETQLVANLQHHFVWSSTWIWPCFVFYVTEWMILVICDSRIIVRQPIVVKAIRVSENKYMPFDI